MRRFRKRSEFAEFTWREPKRWQWRIKFFASICLLAFMVGLMLGQLIHGRPDGLARLQSIETLNDGLLLCFSRAVGVAELNEQGFYGLYVQGVKLEPATGSLQLDGHQVRWSLQPEQSRARLSLLSLPAISGHWQGSDQGCIRVHLRLVQGSDLPD